MRLRTLPLALASIGMGSFLAASIGQFSWNIFFLCSLTTVFLQILSNLANDYGDTVHGADSVNRQGPTRAVQTGAISLLGIKWGIAVFAILALSSGMFLLYISLGFNLNSFLFFLALGILCIIAAYTYTAGKKPYGYAGMGDIAVLIFFGFVGVLGTLYLHTKTLSLIDIMPAISCGVFATAVLNINNIRDIESDKQAGKYSIPVRIGRSKAVTYHWVLLTVGLLTALLYITQLDFSAKRLLFLLVVPLLIKNGLAVAQKKEAMALDPYLKQMALSTLLFVILFGISVL